MATKLKELAEQAGDPSFLRSYNNAADLQKKMSNKKRMISMLNNNFISEIENFQANIDSQPPILPVLLAQQAQSLKKGINETSLRISEMKEEGIQLSEVLAELDIECLDSQLKQDQNTSNEINQYVDSTMSQALNAQVEYHRKFQSIMMKYSNLVDKLDYYEKAGAPKTKGSSNLQEKDGEHSQPNSRSGSPANHY